MQKKRKKSEMAETNTVALKLPPFCKLNHVITDDNTKFVYLHSALLVDIAELMEFAVENATLSDKYTSQTLKAALIKQVGLTKAHKAKMLASFRTLDSSMTPTILLMMLMHMHQLPSDFTSEEYLH